MKANTIFKLMAAPMLLVGGMMMVGCTDSNYDLGNLDKTVAFGSEQGIALPGNNSTKELKLKDLFSLPENGVIKVDETTGEYVFSESASPDATNIMIEQVEMSKENESADDFDYNFAEIFDDIFSARGAKKAPASDEGFREIKHFSFYGDVPEAIKKLEEARFNSTIDITLDFSQDLQDNINELKKMVVYVPTYFMLGVDVYQVNKDNKEIKYDKEVFDSLTNTMTLTSFAFNQRGVHVIIALKGVKFNTNNERDVKDKYFLKMDNNGISMEGGVFMQALYEDAASARGNRAPAAKNLAIGCTTKVGDITIEGGKGNFKPELDFQDGLGKFSIGELPDFLDDDEVKLKVKNPRIVLNISNDINLYGLITEPFIVANYKDGSTKKVGIQPFKINRHENNESSQETSTTTTIVVVNDEASLGDINADFDYSSTVTSNENLTELLEDITAIENISFECSATTDDNEEGNVDLGYEYTIQPEFEFYAPLEFEAGSTIVYSDTISGWHDDLEKLSFTKDSYVEMTADVSNQLPMNLKTEVFPVERHADGTLHKMSADQFVVTVWTGDDESQNLIFAGSSATPRVTKLHVRLTQKDDNALSRIDGIIYRANGVTPQETISEAIKETSHLKLENVGIFLKGKVVTDLDE